MMPKQRKFVVLFLLLVIFASLVGIVWYFATDFEEIPITSEPETEPERRPEPEPYNVTLSLKNFEAIQGESFSINLYMTSLVHESDATTNFSWYLKTYQDQSWSSTEPVPLEITFNPNQPILKYKEPKTIVITINSAKDAPLGEYRVILDVSASAVGSNYSTNRNILITIIP